MLFLFFFKCTKVRAIIFLYFIFRGGWIEILFFSRLLNVNTKKCACVVQSFDCFKLTWNFCNGVYKCSSSLVWNNVKPVSDEKLSRCFLRIGFLVTGKLVMDSNYSCFYPEIFGPAKKKNYVILILFSVQNETKFISQLLLVIFDHLYNFSMN